MTCLDCGQPVGEIHEPSCVHGSSVCPVVLEGDCRDDHLRPKDDREIVGEWEEL